MAAFAFRRAMMPVSLESNSIRAGSRQIPYSKIANFDPREDSWVFQLMLTNGRKIYLSKVRIASQSAFFDELRRRVGEEGS